MLFHQTVCIHCVQFDQNLPRLFQDDAMPRKQCLQIEFFNVHTIPRKGGPCLIIWLHTMTGASAAQFKGPQLSWGLVPFRYICILLWGWSIIFHRLHFPALTLLLKFSIFFGQVFQSRKTQEYCIPFFTILYFQSLNIEELLNLERRKLSVLLLVILPGFPTECCVFVTGGCTEHSESVNIIKCHLHSERLCGFFLKQYSLNISVQFYGYFHTSRYGNNIGETSFAQWTPLIWHNVGHWAFVSIVAMTEYYKILGMLTIFSPQFIVFNGSVPSVLRFLLTSVCILLLQQCCHEGNFCLHSQDSVWQCAIFAMTLESRLIKGHCKQNLYLWLQVLI